MDDSIFAVSWVEYKSLIEEIKPNCTEVKIDTSDNNRHITEVFSKKTGKLIARRVTSWDSETDTRQEEYYIFNLPDNDERGAPRQYVQIELHNKDEVQTFFNIVSKLMKEKDEANG